MKLLLDNNLSPRLVAALEDLYPGSTHVQTFGMGETPDNEVLDFARREGYILVSKDSDFFDPGLIQERDTKIVWVRRGNCSTRDIEQILCGHHDDIARLAASQEISLLMLY